MAAPVSFGFMFYGGKASLVLGCPLRKDVCVRRHVEEEQKTLDRLDCRGGFTRLR